MKSLLKGLFLLVFLTSFTSFGQTGTGSLANPYTVTSFPTTYANHTTANGETAIGMQGACPALVCCSTDVFKVTLPTDGQLRVEMNGFTPLAGSMIAYRSLVATPTAFSDLSYLSQIPANFCGFRDTLMLGRAIEGIHWKNAPYGSVPTILTGLTQVYDFNSPSFQAGYMPAGDYYILIFNTNNQVGIGVGTTVDITFEFAEACAPLTVPTSVNFDTLEYNAQSDTVNFYVKNQRTLDIVIDTANISITGTSAADFTLTPLTDTVLTAGDSVLMQAIFTPTGGGLRNASVEIPFSDTNCSTSSSIAFQGMGAEAEMVLLGNTVSISHNDLTPASNNFTDMGSIVTHTGSIIKEYFITNTGADTLEITGTVTLTGDAQFTVINQPTSTILSGDTSSFKIEFTPTADGLVTTDVSIVNNDAAQTPFTFRIQATGAGLNGLDFDGTNDYVNINSASTAMTGATAFTLETWIKVPTGQAGNDMLLGVNTSSNGSRMFFKIDDGVLEFDVGTTSKVVSSQDIRDDTWHNMVFIFDNGTLAYYLDGVLTSTITNSVPAFAATDKWSIGQEYDNGGASDFLKASLDEFRLWNIARTPAQILDARYCEITNNPTNLVAYYQFNQGIADGNNISITTLTNANASNSTITGTLTGFALNGTTSNFISATNIGTNCTSQWVAVCDNNSYSFGGNTYTTSGLHIDTLTNSNGQDSIVYLDLRINNTVITQNNYSNTTICGSGAFTGDAMTTNRVSTLGFTKSSSHWVELDEVADSLVNTNRSVFLWMRAAGQVSGTQQVLVGMNTSGTGTVTNFGIATNEQLWINDGGSNRNSGITVTDGNWHHVGYTYDEASNLTTFYVDGVAGNSFSNGQSISATSRISLGQEFDGSSTSNFFDGDMTEVTIWNEVLDATDISTLMSEAISNTHAKYNNLMVYYPGNVLCSDNVTTVRDYSGKNLHGVANASAIINTDSLITLTDFDATSHFNFNVNFNGSSFSTANPLNFNPATSGNYVATLSRDFFTITDTINITKSTFPVITQQPVNVTTGLGNNATFSVTASGGPYDYQWKLNELSFSNKTSADGLGSDNPTDISIENGIIYVATHGGLSISTDGGNTFTNKTTTDGLAHNSVKKVLVNNGIIYVATSDGLSISTDLGSSFTTRTTADGLGTNFCNDVYINNGVLYVATGSGLATSIDGGNTFTNIVGSLPSNTCYTVFENNTGLYVSTSSGISVSTNGGTSFTYLFSNSSSKIFESNGIIYFAGRTGGVRNSTTSGSTYPVNPYFSGKTTYDFYESNGTLYAATSEGLATSTDGGTTFTYIDTTDGLTNQHILSVVVNNGTIYLGTIGGFATSTIGISLPGETSNTLTLNNVTAAQDSSQYVVEITSQGSSCSVISDTATLYVGPAVLTATIITDSNVTCNGLINGGATASAFAGTTPYTYLWSNSATTTSITGVAAGIYSVTVTDNVGDTNSTSITITEPMALASSDTVINCGPYTWTNGVMYASSTTATQTFTGSTGCDSIVSLNLTINPLPIIAQQPIDVTAPLASNGTFSVTTTAGPYDYQWKILGDSSISTSNTTTGLGSDSVYDVFVSNGVIYAATHQGLSISTNGGSAFTNKTTANGLAGNTVFNVYESNGTIYASTEFGLSISTDGGNIFTTKTIANGLGDNKCRGVFERNGTLYVTTDGGLSISTDGGNTFSNKTTVNGLVNNNCNAVHESNGTIYVASYGGLSISTDGGNTFITKTGSDGIAGLAYCFDVYEDNGVIYVAVLGIGIPGGLSISTDGGNTFTTKNITNGLAQNHCQFVFANNGVIYASTGAGFSISTDGGNTFTTKSTVDGLGNNNCRGIYESNGSVYVATFGGGLSILSDVADLPGETSNTLTLTNVTAAQDSSQYIVEITSQGSSCSVISDTATLYIGAAVLTASIANDSNVTCKAFSNGGATASATNGTAPYTYLWSNAATTASITGIVAGTYSVTVTDANSDTSSASVTITQPITLLASTVVDSNSTCNGFADGGATASATGGTAPYTYAWSNSATTASFTGIVAGTYTVTITDANGCTNSTSSTITEPAILLAASVVDSNTTNGNSNGGATASATGGTGTYTYSWSNSATTASITGVLAGTYTTTITDGNGCTDLATSTITNTNGPVASITTDSNVTCHGFSNGGATASTATGTAPITYLWSNSATTESITGIAAGTYTVTITDNGSNTSTSSVTITEPTVLTAASVIDSNVSCNGFSDGGATASATGGTMPYTYAWSNSATTASITGVVAGSYSVTITDQNGCTSSTSATVTEPVILSVAIALDSNDLGNGGGATASATGGTVAYTYLWSNGATTAGITSLAAGTYTTTLTDANGCSDTETITITAGPIITMNVDSNVTCNGLTNGGASASIVGGTSPYTYAWNNTITTASITGVPAGSYSLTVTDNNGLTDVSSVSITEPVVLAAASVVDSNITCNGLSNGGATASATGGTAPFTYAWNNSATTASISGVVAGTYNVTITDANGCTSTSAATVTEPTILVSATLVDSSITCNGLSNGGATASATGGTAPYAYAWSNSATTASITGVIAGTYSVTIMDANGCTSTSAATLTEPTLLVASAMVDSNTTCNGASDGGATASATGGTAPYTYAWSNSATTATITGVVAGAYDVTITDANGCSSTSAATVTEPAILLAASVVDSNITCNGLSDGGATASATGGTAPYTYLWDNSATTASITGIIAGMYSVTIMDANGCTSTSSATVTEPTILISASVVDSNTTCNGFADGGATSSATGGTAPYAYAWSNSATTASITGVIAGTYSVTIMDANSCTSASSVTVVEPAILVSASVVDSNITCNGSADGGATASATGGTAPYTYAWSNSATTASITGVIAGTYSVTIMDANGCTSASSATIVEPAILVCASVVDSNITCNGSADGGATASSIGGTAPYTYEWSNTATTASITGVIAGTYSVTISDANGCSSTSSATVTEPTILAAASIVDSNTTCNGSSDGGATASATGGTAPYTFAWDNSAITASITGVVAGTYNVTITDANGCSSTSSSTVTEPTLLVATSVVDSNTTCNGFANGGASASATGGTSPYTYLWSNSATTSSITGVVAGVYSVTIMDANGCTSVSSATITEPLSLVALTVVDSTVSCNGLSDGGATASATGGTAPYTYIWNNSSATASITGVSVGNYIITVSDANGCSSIATVTISEPNILLGNSHVDSNASCDGLPNGGASALPTGGTAPYTYLWSTGATANVITGISVGSYAVTVTDANGCTSIESVIISSNNSTYSFISENACNSYISPSGLFTWTASGTYQDTIPNLAGCDSIITISLTINENGSQQNVTICSGESFTVGQNVYTTTGNYTDVFTNADGCDSTVITDLTVQSVDVSVTQTGFKLEANNTVASYQWINCDSNNAIIPGAINRTYLVTESGNYAVIVTEGGCIDTSACVLVDGLGIGDFAGDREVNVYPNPAGLNTGTVTIYVSNTSNYDIIIRDLTGKMIHLEEGLNTESNQIDISRFAAGTFFIEVRADKFSEYKKLIIM